MNEISITIDVKHYIARFMVKYFQVRLDNILSFDSYTIVALLLYNFNKRLYWGLDWSY